MLDELIRQGKVAAASRASIGRSGIGVAVRAGAPKPDIASVEGFRKTLLAAKSVAFPGEGASGRYFVSLLGRMGIADEMKPKLMPMPASDTVEIVARGEAEMVVVVMPRMSGVPGVDVVGPLPAELQTFIGFAAGVGAQQRARGRERIGAVPLLARGRTGASRQGHRAELSAFVRPPVIGEQGRSKNHAPATPPFGGSEWKSLIWPNPPFPGDERIDAAPPRRRTAKLVQQQRHPWISLLHRPPIRRPPADPFQVRTEVGQARKIIGQEVPHGRQRESHHDVRGGELAAREVFGLLRPRLDEIERPVETLLAVRRGPDCRLPVSTGPVSCSGP